MCELHTAEYSVMHIVLDRLAFIGITNTPLDLFKSYFSGHTQFIQLKTLKSQPLMINTGVPSIDLSAAVTGEF